MLYLKRERERFFLTMRNGDHIPVSTKMAPAIKMYLDHGQLLAAE